MTQSRVTRFLSLFSFAFGLNFSFTYLPLTQLNLVVVLIFPDFSSYILKLVDLVILASSRSLFLNLPHNLSLHNLETMAIDVSWYVENRGLRIGGIDVLSLTEKGAIFIDRISVWAQSLKKWV
jgi:hypothetical protein